MGGPRDEIGGLRGEMNGQRAGIDGLRDEIGGLRGELRTVKLLLCLTLILMVPMTGAVVGLALR